MTYRVELTTQAFEDLSSLDTTLRRRLADKLERLSQDFDRIDPESLSARFKGLYKLRVGDWRVLYTVDQGAAAITVHAIGHRSNIYKRER